MRYKKDYEYYEEDKIRDLLLYRKVEVVDDTTLKLDNGKVLEILANEGCGGCSAGWYSVTELNGCDNAITNVEFDKETLDQYGEMSYKIFVYAENEKIKLVQVDGDDGNGYYGTGYSITVKIKE